MLSKQAFCAEPLNMGCFMNHGYRDNPPHPHVHWQVFPRYNKPVKFNGLTFEDNRYGSFYDDDARRVVGADTVEAIATELRAYLN
jgi:diadenosine tetraphosphate (Ap4A) HIT family hydrolase